MTSTGDGSTVGRRAPGDLDFGAVSETLFIPLYALALESRTKHPILVDEEVIGLAARLNEAFAGSDKRLFKRLARGRLPRTLVTTLALRICRVDQYVGAFLGREPEGIIVNLGCGLDNRRHRVDNGTMRWFDVDLPEVITLRRRFFTEAPRCRFIASSVLDFAWMNELPSAPGHRFLFLAEGLLMYLPEDEVRALVVGLGRRWPGSELIAEVPDRRIVRIMQGRLGRGKFRRQFGLSANVVYQFGLDDGRELEQWAPGFTLLDEWTYFDEPEPKLGWMRLVASWPLLRRVQWLVRYRLGAAPGR
jgi:O-methyltransferase involved in polyketide biosynthesis